MTPAILRGVGGEAELEMAEQHEETVEVAVHSNAGRYPEHGFDKVPASQTVNVELELAAKALGITNLSSWIAKVGAKEIDPTLNALCARVCTAMAPEKGRS
jgi:hypothetical protein